MKSKLIIGLANKAEAVNPNRPGCLLLDDGPIADVFLHKYKRAREFNPNRHSFNPLPMNDRQARDFADIVFGDAGKDTLRV
jgi:hypothetical protein